MSSAAPDSRPGAARRRPADRWPLRSGDLPETRFVNQEAALGEAAENPVYRAMLFGLRSRGFWSRMSPLPRGVVLGISIFLLTGIFSTFWPVLLLIWIPVRNRRSTPSRFFAIPDSLVEDLLQAPPGPRDWTLALWARVLRPGGRSAGPTALFTFLAIVLSVAMLVATRLGPLAVESYAWFAASAGLLMGGLPFLFVPSATGALPSVARQLRGFRIELLRRPHPLLRFVATVFRLAASVGLLFLASGLLVATLMAVSRGVIGSEFYRWSGHPSAPGAFFVAGLLLSGGIGMARRRHVKNYRETYLKTMDQDMSKILETLRYREDPATADVPRPAAAPKRMETRAPDPNSCGSPPSLTHVR